MRKEKQAHFWGACYNADIMTTPREAARIVGISRDSVKRWLETYEEHFSAGAIPPAGTDRILHSIDLRILLYIKALRDSGLRHDKIADRLREASENNWHELPPLAVEQGEITTQRAAEIVSVEVLKRDLAYTRQERDKALEDLEAAQQRVLELQDEITSLQTSSAATERELTDQLHVAQLELERARQDVARLEGTMQQYTLGLAKNPVSPVLIVIMALLFALVLGLIIVGVALLAA